MPTPDTRFLPKPVGSTRGFTTLDPERQGVPGTRPAPRPVASPQGATSSRSGTLHLPPKHRQAASPRP